MYQFLLISIVIIAVALISLILMQQGKGADAGAAFGSGASGTVFGAKGGSTFFSRLTAVLSTLFFICCLAMAWLIANRTSGNVEETSVIDTVIESNTVQDLPSVPTVAPNVVPNDLPVPATPQTNAAPEVVPTDLPVDLPSDVPAASDAIDGVENAVSDALDAATESISDVVDDAGAILEPEIELPELEAPTAPLSE